MPLPDGLPDDVPFSLTCESCDAGMEVESYEHSIALGWTDIVYDPDLLMANFIGLCPECRWLQEQEEQQRRGSSPPASG